MKVLQFTFRGETYKVNEQGQINANGLGYYSNTWIFLGGSKHHWSKRVDIPLSEAFENPLSLNSTLGWDKDNGSTRQWGGIYNGKLPRIRNAHIVIE